MWLNKNYNSASESYAEKGTVTIGGTQNLDAGEGARNAEVFAPYGYSFCAPAGEEVLIVGSPFGGAVAGTKCTQENLKNGEIKICALSGAYILLRADGSVVINGTVIGKNGKITEPIGKAVSYDK